ncbi:dipeptidylpeptidase [Tieghemiomyces parasiticus]|uniref:Dipeptidyl-peptidase V n=1 Tax=Tieghemiomyces parasiticus TaxID=78921 RepID=A0A9W8A8P0_9FUNG|nr:dipeptidylpeptidase [Tieghemiomyces parasiticus]
MQLYGRAAVGFFTLVAVIFGVWISDGVYAQNPLTIRQAAVLPKVANPLVSPDGRHALYTVSENSIDGSGTTTSLYVLDTESNESTLLVRTDPDMGSPANPLWFDNVNVGYTFRTKGRAAKNGTILWAQSINVGYIDATAVTSFPTAIRSLKYSPEGRRLVILADLYPDTTLAETAERDAQLAATKKDTARVFDQLMIRHWDTWWTDKWPTLLAAEVVAGGLDMGGWRLASEPVSLFSNYAAHGRFDFDGFTLSPDGSSAAFAAKLPSRDISWTTDVKVWTIQTDGPTNALLVSDPRVHGAASAPAFTTDGNYIAYLQMMVPQYESDRNRVMVFDRATGSRRAVAARWDRSPTRLAFTRGDQYLLAFAEDQGRRRLFALDWQAKPSAAATPVPLTGDVSVGTWAAYTPDQVLVVLSTWAQPPELYRLDLHLSGATDATRDIKPAPATTTQITNYSGPALANVDCPELIHAWFIGAQGTRIHGMLVKPHGWRENDGVQYPLLVMVHGGPQGAWINSWGTTWNPFVYAAAGYAVWLPNIHGSTGYGQALVDSIHGQWGGYPYLDVMAGITFLGHRFSWIDTTRLSGIGGSYGGFMMNWINGQTDRFKALVSHAGPFSVAASYYFTDEQWFNEYEYDGPPYDPKARPNHERWSPSNYVQNWKTPMLVTQGSKDFRIAEVEGIAAFTALQRRGVPSRLVYFADDGHSITKAPNMVKLVDEALRWFSIYNPAQVTENGSHSIAM